ncbi:N-acetyltransferase family protein [Vibrio sp. RC27]
MIIIRDFKTEDIDVLWSIFFNTIRKININDYSQRQVEAWAPSKFDAELWEKRVSELNPYVAEIDGKVVGYADLQEDGVIEHFYCHHEYQGCGVGRALMSYVLEQAENRGIRRLYSEVSITARPFYEHFGFVTTKEQKVLVRSQRLCNFIMEKSVK